MESRDVVKTFENASPEEKRQVADAPMIFDDRMKQVASYDEEKEDEDNDIMSHLNYRKLQKIKEDFKK